MKLNVLDIVICRTPAFSLNDKIDDKWQELKELIFESSPSFYQAIEHMDLSSILTSHTKIGFTIWKYFNRAKYRATPFGGFAAFTSIPLSKIPSGPLVLNNTILSKYFIDWCEKDAYIDDFNKVVENSSFFQTNSTVYTIGDEIRFIRFKNDCFEMAYVTEFPELKALLKLCKQRSTRQDVNDFMKFKYKLNVKDIDILLAQLLTLQLIITDRFPNITGEDYFERLKIDRKSSHNIFSISERKLIGGEFDSTKIKDLSELIVFLQSNLPVTENTQLRKFRNSFGEKFKEEAVPLTVVMDPEAGVGYGNLGYHLNDPEFNEMKNALNDKHHNQLQINYTALHKFLLNGLIKNTIIRLEDFYGAEIENPCPLPNSFSAMFHFFGDQPVLSSLGGCTANALIGRFTAVSSEIEQFGQRTASLEMEANPDVCFFDIAYQAEKRVDNVNRRKKLYKHELPILTWSCEPSQIHLDDILVFIRNSEVILWSKKWKKRMIPRIPSAYNYTRSDLAVYRFLCDLQHQGIRSDLTFRIQQFFPDLEHYPRVVFKDIIVSPEMWLFPLDLMKVIEQDHISKSKIILENWLQKNGIDFPFRTGFADQTLCFNPEIEEDVIAFLNFCRQNRQIKIYITEALLPDETTIRDNNGEDYAAEYIVSYGHEGEVYSGIQNLTELGVNNQKSKKISLPGNEWLYFEIYCHPARGNAILLNQISLFVKEFRQDIRKWFFIRYDNPKPHLRFRVQLKEPSNGYQLIGRLNTLMEKDYLTGLISDVQIRIYEREVERYGIHRISRVEDFFWYDSKTVLMLLKKEHTVVQLYAITLAIMNKMLICCYDEIDSQIFFVSKMSDSFKKELNMGKDFFKKLNQAFEIHKESFGTAAPHILNKLFFRYEFEFQEILCLCDNESDKVNMMADLIHMHINRLFNADQRIHEAVIYHYLLKVLKSRRGISIVSKEYLREL